VTQDAAGGDVATGASGYFRQLLALTVAALTALVRVPTHSRWAEAGRRLSRIWLILLAVAAVAVVILMVLLDVRAIGAMPVRGDIRLWWVRYVTDFGKADFVLAALALVLLAIVLTLPLARRISRAVWGSLEARVSYLLLAVAVPNLAGEIIKGVVGRGRPFVGGTANAFNFEPLVWQERFASFPSGHSNAAFALAFAVSAIWPKTRYVMWTYALLIGLSRLALLAHHPSDVVAGAVVGVLGAMAVRQWFAVRRLAFIIRANGRIEPLPGPSWRRIKGVARGIFAS
jgi:membrane-associated phospholipid phosphatase